jgi:hypothetical protein
MKAAIPPGREPLSRFLLPHLGQRMDCLGITPPSSRICCRPPLKASQCTIGDDELPMTIHVGMLTNDGIVLAGDKKAHTKPEHGVRHSYMRSKIKIDPTGRIAVTSALDLTDADAFAERVIASASELGRLDWQDRQRRIQEIGGEATGHLEVQSMIAFIDPEPSLYFFQGSRSDNLLSCERRWEPVYSGDISNPAIFLSERYYAILPSLNIKRLAAHVVVVSRRFNGGIIDGLEMVVSGESGFSFVPETEINQLASSVESRDRSIGEMVLAP